MRYIKLGVLREPVTVRAHRLAGAGVGDPQRSQVHRQVLDVLNNSLEKTVWARQRVCARVIRRTHTHQLHMFFTTSRRSTGGIRVAALRFAFLSFFLF